MQRDLSTSLMLSAHHTTDFRSSAYPASTNSRAHMRSWCFIPSIFSLVFLATQSCIRIRDVNIKLVGALNDHFPLLARNAVSNLCRESPVGHQQNLHKNMVAAEMEEKTTACCLAWSRPLIFKFVKTMQLTSLAQRWGQKIIRDLNQTMR